MSHIKHSHENWRQILSAGKMKQDKISFVNKQLPIFLLMLTVSGLLCKFANIRFQKKIVRKYTNLEPICDDTFCKYMIKVTMAVATTIMTILPDIFGLIFDGWTNNSTQYKWFFAFFNYGSFGYVTASRRINNECQ